MRKNFYQNNLLAEACELLTAIDYSKFESDKSLYLLNRVCQHLIFDLTGTILFRIPVVYNSKYAKKDLVREHVFGRKYAANKIVEYMLENKNICDSELFYLLTKYCMWIEVPKERGDVKLLPKTKGKTFNGMIRLHQNKKSGERVTFEEYIQTIQDFGYNISEESYSRLKNYFNN